MHAYRLHMNVSVVSADFLSEKLFWREWIGESTSWKERNGANTSSDLCSSLVLVTKPTYVLHQSMFGLHLLCMHLNLWFI